MAACDAPSRGMAWPGARGRWVCTCWTVGVSRGIGKPAHRLAHHHRPRPLRLARMPAGEREPAHRRSPPAWTAPPFARSDSSPVCPFGRLARARVKSASDAAGSRIPLAALELPFEPCCVRHGSSRTAMHGGTGHLAEGAPTRPALDRALARHHAGVGLEGRHRSGTQGTAASTQPHQSCCE